MTDRTYRRAIPGDAARGIEIRGRTRENAFCAEALRALGITAESWGAGIEDGSCPDSGGAYRSPDVEPVRMAHPAKGREACSRPLAHKRIDVPGAWMIISAGIAIPGPAMEECQWLLTKHSSP